MKPDSAFLKKYISRMTDAMLHAHPTWTKAEVRSAIEDMVYERFKTPRVILDNNYTGEQKETSLISVIDWIIDRKPLIAGNGTFYKSHKEELNPIAKMLDGMAAKRKKYKKQMFQAGDMYGFDSHAYSDFDRKQLNEKINMNSYYGGSGAPTSAFYSKWSGAATTLTAQSVISTAETLFESFLADNYIFLDMNELVDWLRVVMKEEDTFVHPFIVKMSKMDLVDRLMCKLLTVEDKDEEFLYEFISGLDDDMITRIYYKNNLIEFIDRHQEIQDIIRDILITVPNYDYASKSDDWLADIPEEYRSEYADKPKKKWNEFVNHKFFMDPNNPPEEIIPLLDQLLEYIRKYIYVEEFLSFDRIYRLKNFKRQVVTVIDTDSNFLSLDTLMNFLIDRVVDVYGYGRPVDNNIYILVNTITYIISDVIRRTLLYYGKSSNVPENERPRLDMKNEFFDELLVIGDTKKRYITKQILREGNLLNPPKSDVKGFDLKKASTSEFAEKKFMKIINECILGTSLQPKKMVQMVKAFKDEVRESILSGDRTYLPNGNAKELSAYKDPGSEQSVRGVLTWNMINPDNQIEFPSKVSLVKMNIFDITDAEPLKEKYPNIYKIIEDKIFNDKSGIFVVSTWNLPIKYVSSNKKNWFEDIPKKYRTKYKKLGPAAWNKFVDSIEDGTCKSKIREEELVGYYSYRKRGLQVLAIPSNSTIPDWAMPFVDIDTMVNNIIAPINPVLEIFGFKFPEVGRSKNGVSRKTNTVSNIIKF